MFGKPNAQLAGIIQVNIITKPIIMIFRSMLKNSLIIPKLLMKASKIINENYLNVGKHYLMNLLNPNMKYIIIISIFGEQHAGILRLLILNMDTVLQRKRAVVYILFR